MSAQESQSSPLTSVETTSEPHANSTTTSTTDAAQSASTAGTKCAHCHADEKPLKPCSKCQAALYCSRDCQKAAWKLHKKTCASDAQIYAMTADLKPASAPRLPKKEGHRGGLQKWQFDT